MIGIFDSGLGGLRLAYRLHALCPTSDITYIGDTAHLPYGTRAPDTVLRFTASALDAFSEMGASYVLLACGTASSLALPRIGKYPFPVSGILTPAVAYACKEYPHGRFLVLGTDGTARSRAFTEALYAGGAAYAETCPCPLFVPLAENGFTDRDDPTARAAVAHYLAPYRGDDIDAILLACTHFPLLTPLIEDVLPGIPLIDCGEQALCALTPIVRGQREHGDMRLYVTELSGSYFAAARHFTHGGETPQIHSIVLNA